ncbi:probable leucine-rich repeat receptor-like protein kinase IMK3 isoform X3 [Prunus avium]|uniref:Probable leucine-rich repeat receptor-like protein kinase IMK3 isoform X3 n=1 Tax=Prunus avium TaxID=42229 RepID=A0A6P5RH70_PRUAV|nr:probable leucine-rich repeat receptor-like protein kinase IMK3 isoform X3 [Prunus avium]
MTLTNMVGVRCFFKLLYAIVVLILLHMNNPCIGCSERESQALLALKQGLVADDGGPSLSWGREAQNKDCCGWDGVHCSDQTGHVVKLDLQDQYLQGQIPSRIGNLQELDSLDLSRNQINGRIPISISWINRIGYLDLSENNLSGKIPIGTQLQTFDSAYGGNPLLCGEPLPRICSEEEKGPRQFVLVNEDDKDGLITQGFYISMGLGFAVGFWGVCGTLLLNMSCRYTYFNFLTFLNDWLYVNVEIIRQRILNK